MTRYSVRKYNPALLLGVLLMAPTLRGDVITTFDASGLFSNGSTLNGTVTIDVTTGRATALDLTVSAPSSLTFNVIDFQEQVNQPFSYLINAGPVAPYEFDFALPAHNLIGYAGGNICSVSNRFMCESVSDLLNSGVSLQSGALTPAAAPEPSSLMLFGGGALGLACIIIRRKLLG